MNLGTFLKPTALTLSPSPDIGQAPPSLIGHRLRIISPPYIIIFLRHVGCPFAEATFINARSLSRTTPDAKFVVVSHAGPVETDRWYNMLGGPGELTLVCDPARRMYATWGLGLTTLSHFVGWRSLAAVLKVYSKGIRNRSPSGSRWQMAGSFAVCASGQTVWRHIPDHAGDLPELGDAVTACTAPLSENREALVL